MSSIFFHTEVLNFNVIKIIALHFMAYGFSSHAQKGFSNIIKMFWIFLWHFYSFFVFVFVFV